MNGAECGICVKKKTIYCPNSDRCFETKNKPYFQNKFMLLEENKKYKEVINKMKTNLYYSINAINKKLSNNNFRVENGKAIYPINDYCVVRLKGIRTKCKELLKILEEVDDK